MSTLTCRACGAPLTRTLVDLGETALANSYVKPEKAGTVDKAYPLHARVCDQCYLVQVEDVVPAEDIFSDYAYFSSYAASWVEHAKAYCDLTQQRLGLGKDSFVVEVASNDGYLLQHFVGKGVPCLGVEPAANVADVAREKGVPTLTAFFGLDTARKVRDEHGAANLTAANNVLAHVPDINDFVAGFAHLLADEGVSTFEFPHLLNLMKYVQFDTIYHEHFSYLSLYAVEKLFARHGLRVFDVQELPTHGGSLRVWACRRDAAYADTDGLRKVRADEAEFGMATPEAYDGFNARVVAVKDGLLKFLTTAKAEGKTVVAYGAAAKGNTLLNYCGVGPDLIKMVADANPHKQNQLLPGSHIPIVAPEDLAAAQPDYVLILPWNLKAEIAEKMAHLRQCGAKFATAVPAMDIF